MRAPRPLDAALAGAVLVTGPIEVAANPLEIDRPVVAMIAVLIAAAAMLVRSSRPQVCLAVVVAVMVGVEIPGVSAVTAAVVAATVIALGTVGRRCPEPTSTATAAATIALLMLTGAFWSRPWDAVVWLLVGGTAWGVGRLLRREAERNADLAALADKLAAERDIRAREAVNAERTRIARELHDAVAHTVSVMTLQAGGVRRRLDADPERVRERDVLLDIERLGREAVEELHRAVGILRAPGDDAALAPQPGLADLDQLATRVRTAGVPVSVRVEGAPRPLPAGIELAAYRVTQEALTNTLKHAGQATAEVVVRYSDAQLTLIVDDDGRGHPELSETTRQGHGLAGMQERVALYGGKIEAGPTAAGGYQVRAVLPLPQRVAG